MTGERMPLARAMIATGKLGKDVVLFDVQVAYDILYAKGVFDPDQLGPVRPPYPDMFFEWDLTELKDTPLTEADLTENMRRLGITEMDLLQERDVVIVKVGCRVQEGAQNLMFRPYLVDSRGSLCDFGVGMLVGVRDDGMATGGIQYADLLGDGREIAEEYRPYRNEVLEEVRPTANGAAQVGLMALSLINCRNVRTEQLGTIRMRRSGAQKRRKEPPVEVRYSTIILPGGGSQRVGTGTGAHHRAAALHKVRGHPKTFTADAPLFGKHVGTYWWGWQLRGDPDKGVIESDYLLGDKYAEAQ